MGKLLTSDCGRQPPVGSQTPACAFLNGMSVSLVAPSPSLPLCLSSLLPALSLASSALLLAPAFYTAAPLTSAGILPVMQSLCPDGQRDEFGFLQYSNST